MEKSHGPFNSIEIPEEIVIEILRRLPLKSLHKFKWVSKLWHSLIAEEIIPKTLNPQSICFFIQSLYYGNSNDITNNVTSIIPEFSFLPTSVSNVSILDCCNGLILCCTMLDVYPNAYYVCNPITKSWTQLPWIGYHDFHNHKMILDFNPYVSAHYKVFSVQTFGDQLLILIYHSETRRMEHKWACSGYRFLHGIARLHCSMWNGAVYLYMRRDGYLEEKYKTMRFAITEGDVVYPEFINFPLGTKLPSDGACIGRLGGKFCFVGLDGQRLRLWTLGGKCENEWVMAHKYTICAPSKFNLVGFHPLQNLVIILLDCVIFKCDLKEMSVHETGRIGLEGIERDSTTVFTFFPFLLDTLENRNYK